jgi:hypothetical protein
MIAFVFAAVVVISGIQSGAGQAPLRMRATLTTR